MLQKCAILSNGVGIELSVNNLPVRCVAGLWQGQASYIMLPLIDRLMSVDVALTAMRMIAWSMGGGSHHGRRTEVRMVLYVATRH